jgi:hypothetical protein
MFQRVARVKQHLREKWDQGVIPEDKRRQASLLFEDIPREYNASFSLLIGVWMSYYGIVSILFSIPMILLPPTRIFYDLTVQTGSLFLFVFWLLGGLLSKLEWKLRSYDTGIGNIFGIFSSQPVVEESFSPSKGEDIKRGEVEEEVEDGEISAYRKKVDREWTKLLDIISRYPDNDTIYLGNDFMSSLTHDNILKLSDRGYYYHTYLGNVRLHNLEMTTPCGCTLF